MVAMDEGCGFGYDAACVSFNATLAACSVSAENRGGGECDALF